MGHKFEDDLNKFHELKEQSAEHDEMTMERYTLGFLWTAQRKDHEEKFGISLNFDESRNKIEVASVAELSLAAEQNHNLNMHPQTSAYSLQTGDIVEAVSWQKSIDAIQKELQTALSVKLYVRRAEYLYVC